MILIDSNIIIALFDSNDVHHKKAVSLLTAIGEQRDYTLSVNLLEIYSVIA